MSPDVSQKYLLDASALLAMFHQEPGAEVVDGILNRASVHAVQVAEAARKLRQKGVEEGWLESALASLQLPVIEDVTLRQACLSARYDRGGLSLGDRLCLTVADWHAMTAVTADRRWKEVCDADPDINARVLLIR